MKESVVNIKDVIYQDTPENKSEETMVEASAFEEKISSISERKKTATETDNISVKEDDVNGEVIPYEINTDEIVTIGAISDTKGILSDRIDAVMQEYHVRAIQVEAAGILPQVTELQRHDLLKLNDVNYAMSRDVDKKMLLAYRQTIYDTLSSGLPYREILTDTIKVTTEWAKQNVSTLAGKAKYLADVVVGDHVFAVIKPELLFNALRVECNEYVPGKDKTAVEYLYPFRTAICNWITETAAYCTVTPAWSGNTARDLQRVIIDSDYVDVQILYNGIPVFHFPEDFFFEYYEEIEAWGREHRMPATVMTEGNSLLLSFSDVSSYTIQARKVPVSLSLDLKSKIRLLEENDCRYNMPIMKAKMLEYMRDNGKDPSVLDNVGLQMVITLVQVLLLQDTPEYKTLFQRDDSFLAGFNALKWMVRSDDNLYSAVMRYAFALTSIYNEYSNAKISETLQSYAIVNGTQMPILSVFSKNKSLLQFLQENKKSCKVNVEGDVMRIEKA